VIGNAATTSNYGFLLKLALVVTALALATGLGREPGSGRLGLRVV